MERCTARRGVDVLELSTHQVVAIVAIIAIVAIVTIVAIDSVAVQAQAHGSASVSYAAIAAAVTGSTTTEATVGPCAAD